MTKNYEWGTSTLGIAATVKALGAEYVRCDKSNPRSMVFYFRVPDDTSGLEYMLGEFDFSFDVVAADYINGKWIRLSPKAYYQALNDLKSIIHSQ